MPDGASGADHRVVPANGSLVVDCGWHRGRQIAIARPRVDPVSVLARPIDVRLELDLPVVMELKLCCDGAVERK